MKTERSNSDLVKEKKKNAKIVLRKRGEKWWRIYLMCIVLGTKRGIGTG